MEINQEGDIIDMFVKRFKRKCSVRGCKNTANVYLISKRREMGNTIGICTDCLKDAMSSIETYTEPPKVKKEDKPLFPHPELKEVIEEDVTDDSAAIEEPIIATTKPDVVLPSEVTQINSKKKPNNKKK